MKPIILFLALIPSVALALEVDEKLTARIVKTSESKKTIMVNRGIEDGLVEGDHAKFVVTAGIVARGVVVKVSPTRSVWSLYRLVNADFIVNDSVMTLKITPPVKITKDETQALVQEDTPTTVASGDPAALGIPLADGAQDLNAADAAMSDTDLKALEASNATPTSIVEKNRELYGFLNLSGLSASTKTDDGEESFSGSQSFYHLGLGGEYYPQNERVWFSGFSVVAEVAHIRENSQSFSGANVTNQLTEFAGGINWHPTKRPSSVNEFIPFLHATANVGMLNATYTQGSTLAGRTESSASASTMGFSLGAGYKFYTYRGFGARMMLDYYFRSESYQGDDAGINWVKSVGGPRLMMAISYRF